MRDRWLIIDFISRMCSPSLNIRMHLQTLGNISVEPEGETGEEVPGGDQAGDGPQAEPRRF